MIFVLDVNKDSEHIKVVDIISKVPDKPNPKYLYATPEEIGTLDEKILRVKKGLKINVKKY